MKPGKICNVYCHSYSRFRNIQETSRSHEGCFDPQGKLASLCNALTFLKKQSCFEFLTYMTPVGLATLMNESDNNTHMSTCSNLCS